MCDSFRRWEDVQVMSILTCVENSMFVVDEPGYIYIYLSSLLPL